MFMVVLPDHNYTLMLKMLLFHELRDLALMSYNLFHYLSNLALGK